MTQHKVFSGQYELIVEVRDEDYPKNVVVETALLHLLEPVVMKLHENLYITSAPERRILIADVSLAQIDSVTVILDVFKQYIGATLTPTYSLKDKAWPTGPLPTFTWEYGTYSVENAI